MTSDTTDISFEEESDVATDSGGISLDFGDDPEVDELADRDLKWVRAVTFSIAALVLVGVSVLVLATVSGFRLAAQAGVVVGLISAAAAVRDLVTSHQIAMARHERTVLEDIEKLRNEIHSTEYEELIDELQKQRRIATQLVDDLPGQQEQIEELLQALEGQDQTIRSLIEQDIEARREEIDSLREVKEDL